MRTAAALFVAAVVTAAPAIAQKKVFPIDVSPPVLAAGEMEIGDAQPIEQDLPAAFSAQGVVRDGVRIYFAQRYVDTPRSTATLGQIDTGNFAATGGWKDMAACEQSLAAAVDRLANEAKKLGANSVIGVGPVIDGGYLPGHPAYLCVRSSLRNPTLKTPGASTIIPKIVARVRLAGTAAILP